MGYLDYGIQSTKAMYDLVDDVAAKDKRKAINDINHYFFGGTPFITDKSFKAVFNVSKPSPSISGHQILIGKKKDFYVVWGVIEGVPFLGSLLAIFAIIGNSFHLLSTEIKLKKAVAALPARIDDPSTLIGAKYFKKANKVFTITVERTLAENRIYGSLASLIPYLKPAMIGWQAGMYHIFKSCPTKIAGASGI